MHDTRQGVHDQAAMIAKLVRRIDALERAAGQQIDTAGLVDLSVTTPKIAAGAVTNAKLDAEAYNTGRIIARATSTMSGTSVGGSAVAMWTPINFGHVAGRTYKFTVTIRAVKSTTGGNAGVIVALLINGTFMNDKHIYAPINSAPFGSGDLTFLWDATTTGVSTFGATVTAVTNNTNVYAESQHHVQDMGPT